MNLKHLSKTESSIVLIGLNYYFFEEQDLALEMLSDIMEKYPDSGLMWYIRGLFNRLSGNVKTAITDLTTCLELSTGHQTLINNAHYNLGYSFFLRNKYAKASEYLEMYLDNSPLPNYKPYTAYLCGFCYWMTDNRDKIDNYYGCVSEWVRPNESYDEYALQKVDLFYKTEGFTPFEEIYIPAVALHEGKFDKRALKQIEKIIPILKENADNRDYYAMYYYLKGSILKELGQTERAQEILKKALNNYKQLSKYALYAVPHAYFVLAEIEFEAGDFNSTDRFIKKSKRI